MPLTDLKLRQLKPATPPFRESDGGGLLIEVRRGGSPTGSRASRSFGGLLRTVWGYQGAVETQAALKLLVLLYPRPGEQRLASWEEFDLKRAIWTIPADRTKDAARAREAPAAGGD